VTAGRGVRPAAVAGALALATAVLALPAPAAVVLPGTGSIELAFTPGDAIDDRLVALVDAAEREVLVQAFSFTQRRLARALIAAHRRGVAVAVLADRAQALETPHSAVTDLAAAGVPVWLDGSHAAAHNKVLIVDAALPRATTVTGSYNFTVAAQKRNAENVAIFRDNPGVAQAYRDNFRRLQARALRHGEPAGAARSRAPG
jgi:phosphatidylserine/phosphatidylglycerophosphate/cardiolipin synthase-like enzyme